MNFEFQEEHMLINDSIDRVLQKECAAADLRDSGQGKSSERWRSLANLGVLGLLLSEERGGLEDNELALITAGQTFGKYALPEPVLQSLAVVVPLLAKLEQGGSKLAGELLDQTLSGDRCFAAFDPTLASNVISGRCDGVLFQCEGRWLFASDASAIMEFTPSLDPARVPYSLADSSTGESLGSLDDASYSVITQRGTLAVSAELIGLGNRLLEMAVEYAQMRTQFGKPIAGFQAVQHSLADVWTALRFATPVLNRAAWTVSVGDSAAPLHVSHAKIASREAADTAAKTAIQIFGAMGYTYESDLHFWLKRVWSLKDFWGSRAYHEGIIAAELTKPGVVGPGAAFPHRPS